MQFTIKSRKLNTTLTFTRPSRSYIFVSINGKEGILGCQICQGGSLAGSTITYFGDNDTEFEAIVRKWYRSYLRNN
jgi:hypothetical protein